MTAENKEALEYVVGLSKPEIIKEGIAWKNRRKR